MASRNPQALEWRLAAALQDLVDAVAHASRQSDRIYGPACETAMRIAETVLEERRKNGHDSDRR